MQRYGLSPSGIHPHKSFSSHETGKCVSLPHEFKASIQMNSLFPDLFDEGKTPEAPAAAQPTPEYDLTDLFERLSHSPFRSRFRLKPADIAYIREKGMDTIRQHAADFIRKRLAPAVIPNDGKQTPMRGHPVFIAQHATGCCCRGCFAKWHHIPAGRPLTPEEQRYAVAVLMKWIEQFT